MSEKQKLTFLKFIAVAAAGYYLYHLSKAQGSSLQGRINPEKIASLGASLFPQEYRPYVRQFGAEWLRRIQ